MPAYNTPLTLGSLKSVVRNLILERSGDVGLVTDTELSEIIQFASRMIWNRIATRYPETFGKRSGANLVPTVASGVYLVPFSAVTANASQVFKILNVYVAATGAAEGSMKSLPSFDRTRERWLYEPAVSPPALPSRWYTEGNTIYFSPNPSATFDCRVAWVELPQDITSDADTLWGGTPPAAIYGDTVAVLAAKMALSKDQKLQTGYDAVFQYIDSVMQEQMGPATQQSPNDPRG